jgi:ABC-type dipeptide/oligopeptide/nickel transport system permease subunit
MKGRRMQAILAGLVLAALLLAALLAPSRLPEVRPELAYADPLHMMPFGADNRGRPLLDYALQGARVVALPALGASLLVVLLGTLGGLLRCTGSERVEAAAHAVRELVGALPRMVVILVVALVVPVEWRSLGALAVAWALLAAPGAMDESAALAGRLGGARFIEALRAHGFSRMRIWGWHVVALNLRPVLVRQGAETFMQVVFLEIGLSYLALAETQPSFTHADEMRSWADILYLGYPSVILDVPTTHALLLGLGLMGLVAVLTVSATAAARAR